MPISSVKNVAPNRRRPPAVPRSLHTTPDATQEISFDATTLTIAGFGLIAFQFFVVANL